MTTWIEKRRVAAVALYMVVALVGICILAFVSRDYLAVREAKTARLEEVPGELHQVELRTISGSPRGVAYRVEANYGYSYRGEQYTSERVGYGRIKWMNRLTHREAQNIVDELKSRDPFVVFVDGRDPSRAVLLPGAGDVIWWDTILVTVVGLAFLMVGGYSAIATLLSKRLRSVRTTR